MPLMTPQHSASYAHRIISCASHHPNATYVIHCTFRLRQTVTEKFHTERKIESAVTINGGGGGGRWRRGMQITVMVPIIEHIKL